MQVRTCHFLSEFQSQNVRNARLTAGERRVRGLRPLPAGGHQHREAVMVWPKISHTQHTPAQVNRLLIRKTISVSLVSPVQKLSSHSFHLS